MLKRFLSIIMVITIFVNMPLMVVASETEVSSVGINTGDAMCPDATLEEMLSKLTEEEQEMILKRIEEGKNYQSPTTWSTEATWTTLTDFVIYTQQTSYYCVVACVKSAIQHIKGSSDAQNLIATDLGVTVNVGASLQDAQ